MAIQSEIDSAKTQRQWGWTKGCTEVQGKSNRDFCQQYHALASELASATQADVLRQQIAGLKSKLALTEGGTVLSEADPQAAVLAKLLAVIGISMKIEDMQTTLALFVALLLEIGSGFGMYVAFSSWRLYDQAAPSVPTMVPAVQTTPSVVETAAIVAPKPLGIANDNKSLPAQKQVAPETDVERFRRERIDAAEGSSLTATTLYEDYCAWCEGQEKEPLALPTFGREFGELGVQKAKIAGRVRYIGVALKSGQQLLEEDKKLTASRAEAA